MTGQRSLPGDITLGWCSLEGEPGHDAAWRLLQQLYQHRTGRQLPPTAVTERGKPYFTAGALHFSISHTKNHAFCAIAPVNLGIDAEEMDRPIKLSLAEKILSPAEMERFHAAVDSRAALLRLWVLKEAAAKRSGEGLRGYPNDTDFSPEDSRIYEIDGCYVAVLTEGD